MSFAFLRTGAVGVRGIEAYCDWDNPATAINESYQTTATLDTVS